LQKISNISNGVLTMCVALAFMKDSTIFLKLK